MMQIHPPHKREDAEWRRIHDDKPTLASFSTGGGIGGASEGVRYTVWATKKGKAGMFGATWNRRYWLLVGQFFIYFDNDQPTARAGGCIYLNSARFEPVASLDAKQNVLQIRPTVPRRPGMSIDTEDNVWLLSFDTAGELDKSATTLKSASLARHEISRAPSATTYE